MTLAALEPPTSESNDCQRRIRRIPRTKLRRSQSRPKRQLWWSLLLMLLLCPLSRNDGVLALDDNEDRPPASNAQQQQRHRSVRIGGGGSAQVEAASAPPAATTTTTNKVGSLNQILIKAGKRGLGGGIPGAIAGAVQVVTLMWLRTIINYQCRYGTTFSMALQTLLRQGGIPRLYRGLPLALLQAPLSRFASTAANDGVQAFLGSFAATASWGPGRQTVVASIFVGFWRMMLMPIDTMKTVLQVDSTEGFRTLIRRVKSGKINVLYQGSVAQAISAIVGHYPWVSIQTMRQGTSVVVTNCSRLPSILVLHV